MAANTSSPSVVSYAQAAKGRPSTMTSQTQTSKSAAGTASTSGSATPASGTLNEPLNSASWADDVESTVGETKVGAQPVKEAEPVSSPPKDAMVEAVKNEVQQEEHIVSQASSPDITASSSTTKEDDASSVPHASASDSTWETKSQNSEPQWIAERSQRQNSNQQNGKASKGEKVAKETPLPAPVKPAAPLQEAMPPAENPWLKRAAQRAQAAAKPATSPTSTDASKNKENQKPATDARLNSTSSSNALTEAVTVNGADAPKIGDVQTKRASDARPASSQKGWKTSFSESRSHSPLANATKIASAERPSLPITSAAPPSVNDQTSWPTPDLAEKADKERKPSTEGQSTKAEDDSAPAAKRKKPQFTTLAITPTFKFETQLDPRKRGPVNAAERTPRPSNVSRGGRGGYRGPNGGDRQTVVSETSPTKDQSDASSAVGTAVEARNRGAMPPPAKPVRASSDGTNQDRKRESPVDRNPRGLGLTDVKPNSEHEVPSTDETPNGEARRARSPKKVDADNKEEILPKPIPRQPSSSTIVDESPESATKSSRGAPPVRMVPSESRKEGRNFGESRDQSFNGPPRGGKRNGRGRGGARDMANGHPPTSTYPGNYPSDFAAASPYTVPPSPGAPHTSRGHHMPYSPAGRGNWRGGNTRSQSIPMDAYYNRFGVQYPGGQQAPPYLQTQFSGMYDIHGYPMSAMPYPMHPDMHQMMSPAGAQLEYYFSEENLTKDFWFRSHMDSQGFVFLDVIAGFPRMKSFSQDQDYLRAVCLTLPTVEIRKGDDGRERVRRREGWEQYILPMDKRHESARNPGPERLERIERPQVAVSNLPPQFRGPASAIGPAYGRYDRRSYDATYSMMDGYGAQFASFGGFPEEMVPNGVNGHEARGRTVKSPSREHVQSPTHMERPAPSVNGMAAEADAFSDDQIPALTVVVRMDEKRTSYHSAASRTFSNGSIDSRNVLPEADAPLNGKAKGLGNGESFLNGGRDDGATLTRTLSPNKTVPVERTPSGPGGSNLFWVKDQEFPIDSLPQDINTYPYSELHQQAMQQRSTASTGTCPPMLTMLYEFWCHFLIRNFNAAMYSGFKNLAESDAQDRFEFTGLQKLVTFYAKSLASQNPIRDRVVRDYVHLVKNEPAKLDNAAFKSLRSAWRNGALNLKNRKKLTDVLDEALKEKLDQHVSDINNAGST